MSNLVGNTEERFSKFKVTVMIIRFWTYCSEQIVQTQIRLLLEEQSNSADPDQTAPRGAV